MDLKKGKLVSIDVDGWPDVMSGTFEGIEVVGDNYFMVLKMEFDEVYKFNFRYIRRIGG